jgi:hypothetical protein
MSTSTITTQTIPGRGQQESDILKLLAELTGDAGGQLGDLGQLAQGDLSMLGPSGQDQELVSQSITRAAEMARRALQGQLQLGGANLDEELAARGIQGSSIEGFRRAGLEAGAFNQILNVTEGAAQRGGEALLNLPFQRANVQLNANQALFNRILGAGGLVAQTGLQERLAQPTTETPFSAAQGLQLGQQIGAVAAAPFTGGASLALMGAGANPTSAQGSAASQSNSLLPGFQGGLGAGGARR